MKDKSKISIVIILAVVLSALLAYIIINRNAGAVSGTDGDAATDTNPGVVRDQDQYKDTDGDEIEATAAPSDADGAADAAQDGDADTNDSEGSASKPDILLVNADNPLPADFEPPELVSLFAQKDRHFQLARADIEVTGAVFDAMDEMFASAEQDGVNGFIITSGYRSAERQEEILAGDDVGVAARPGESEHETGLAFDVVAMGDENFDQTPQFEWLYEHCGQFGFILRYPYGAEDVTGVPYESWHYRYVGVEHAEAIMDAGITLEQYLAGDSPL